MTDVRLIDLSPGPEDEGEEADDPEDDAEHDQHEDVQRHVLL